MQRQAIAPPPRPRPDFELEYPDRRNLPQNPDAQAVSQYPHAAGTFVHSPSGTIQPRLAHSTAPR